MGKEVDDKNANGRMVKREMAGGKALHQGILFYTSGFFFWGGMAHMYFLRHGLGEENHWTD